MKSFTNSNYWLFFYSFFIISFIPYFIIRFSDQGWIYEILYRPNGIVENMTVLLYVISAFFVGQEIFKFKNRNLTLLAVFALSVFMIGEETRWGLGFFVDELRDLYLTGFQDILVYAVNGIPERFPLYLVVFLFIVRIALFCVIGGSLIWSWYHRHSINVLKNKVKAYEFSSFAFVYALLILGVIILELFIQPGPRKLDYIEETFELNAALILMLISYESSIIFKRIF